MPILRVIKAENNNIMSCKIGKLKPVLLLKTGLIKY